MVNTIIINRAPVLTLWGVIVAERLGYTHDEALTLGKAVAELTARLKGRLPRIYSASENELDKEMRKHAKEPQPGDTVMVDLVGRRVTALVTTHGLRATVDGKEITPKSVERYLEQKFGGNLDEVRAAFEELAQSYPPDELQQRAYDLYRQFRPPHAVETAGWGGEDELSLERIRKMTSKE